MNKTPARRVNGRPSTTTRRWALAAGMTEGGVTAEGVAGFIGWPRAAPHAGQKLAPGPMVASQGLQG